jgi:hypothetical protein
MARQRGAAPQGRGASVNSTVSATKAHGSNGSNGNRAVGPLRQILDDQVELGYTLADLTVLATQHDPFRQDTPTGHRDGEWLAVNIRDLGLADRPIHLRGLHYALLGRAKPNGLPYTNTEADWTWLQEHPGKAARWLGYVDFDRIIDARNAAPVVRRRKIDEPRPYLTVGLNIEVPDVDDIEPTIGVDDFVGVQPYHLTFFGEKSSLEPVLGPIAEQYGADLYLPTGEISDTLLHGMARDAVADGRPMVVFTFSDCDPAGWQMPVSIGHKLRALSELFEEGGEGFVFEVRRVGLLPRHVRQYGLPSTPLKATERRADAWREATGIEQTEIDALAALRPGLLRQIATEFLRPFYDPTLARRVREARRVWEAEAQARLDASLDPEERNRVRAEAAEKLEALRENIEEINQQLQVDVGDLDLPEIDVPEPEIDVEPEDEPLCDSRWSFVEHATRLKASKAYDE